MDREFACVIYFEPTSYLVDAHIEILTSQMIDERITRCWWTDPALKGHFRPAPIDRDWDWGTLAIKYEVILESEVVGLMTGDGYVQGAMLISSAPVPSSLEPGKGALFVELLFTAPRNRSALRKDGMKYFTGVGPELLRWAATFSQERGCQGRVKLDASPEYRAWYAKVGFEELHVEAAPATCIRYVPMELPAVAVDWLQNPEQKRKRKELSR